MKIKGFAIILNLFILSVITGCNLLPEASSLISAPNYPKAAEDNSDIKLVAKSFLPNGARFLYPVNPKGVDAVQLVDIDGDGQDEIFVSYKDNSAGSGWGAILLKKSNGEWHEIWNDEYMVNIIGLDWAHFIDITGDKIPELLLGWNMGFEVGYNLDITSFKGTPKKVFSINYNEMDITNISGNENEKKPEIILTRKEPDQREINVPPLVLRWDEDSLVPAEDAYYVYFKDMINALEESNRLYDRTFLNWYNLSEMQVKSKKSLDAIKSADRALSIIPPHYEKYRIKLEIYKAEALIQVGKFSEGMNILNNIIYRNDTSQIGCTQDELAAVYLNLGRAYMGLKDYKTAKSKYSQSYDIIKFAYGEGTELFKLNSFTVKKEIAQLNALTQIINYN
ncbi:MAG: hypothetical protein BWY74_01533 [Firmicutes bacterium ADurb.Bin419]|nr:MAG: hypothetical protein BWY74_01533 [Firmicutes bacterium ADurb.Bin419]